MIGHRSNTPGTIRNSAISAAITAIDAWNPNARIGSSSLTTSDARPIEVVPADNRQGSQPRRMARAAAPLLPPEVSDSTR